MAVLIAVTATDGHRAWRYAPEDLATRTAEVVAATVAIPLKPDWRLSVDVTADTVDPIHRCFGCEGSRAFPLPVNMQRAADDSLYVVWGGNSIQDPVIYQAVIPRPAWAPK